MDEISQVTALMTFTICCSSDAEPCFWNDKSFLVCKDNFNLTLKLYMLYLIK